MRILQLLGIIIGLATPAAAVAPYEGTTISTAAGYATHTLSGKFDLAASSSTSSTFTMVLNGLNGSITAGALTLSGDLNMSGSVARNVTLTNAGSTSQRIASLSFADASQTVTTIEPYGETTGNIGSGGGFPGAGALWFYGSHASSRFLWSAGATTTLDWAVLPGQLYAGQPLTSVSSVTANALLILSSTFTVAAGKVGIGTNNPLAVLQSSGSAIIGSGFFRNEYSLYTGYLRGASGANGNLHLVPSATAGIVDIQSYGGGTMLYANGNNGNVGIGGTTALTALDVTGALRTSQNIIDIGSMTVQGASGLGVTYGVTAATMALAGGSTASTAYDLEIGAGSSLPNGGIRINGASGNNMIDFATGSTDRYLAYISGGDFRLYSYALAADAANFTSGGSLTIAKGISASTGSFSGTLISTGDMQTSGNIFVNGAVKALGANNNAEIDGVGTGGLRINNGQGAGGVHVFNGGATEILTVLNGGAVGFGTTAPITQESLSLVKASSPGIFISTSPNATFNGNQAWQGDIFYGSGYASLNGHTDRLSLRSVLASVTAYRTPISLSSNGVEFLSTGDDSTQTLIIPNAAITTGQALCLDSGHNLGHCTSAVGAGGACTCSSP